MPKTRLDILLTERGLVESRAKAQALIMAGQVRVDGQTALKAGASVSAESTLTVDAGPRFVSRGGEKLDAALEAFALDVRGLVCADVGASTGGFTDCLLQRGARSVIAVDVGRAQLHMKLRDDARVTLLEGVNARALPELPPVGLFVADLSFISLRKVLPSVASRVAPGTEGVVLLKPQFEAGPRDVPRGGVIRDPAVQERVLGDFLAWLEAEGWSRDGVIPSPIRGGDGNLEYLVHVHTPAGAEAPC